MAEPEKREETDEVDGKRKPRLEIKPTQVAGGALAAVTAAVLGARLGMAGTVLGAGVASVVTTVGGALYQHSLERTRDTVKVVATKLPLGSHGAERTAVDTTLATRTWEGDRGDQNTMWAGRPMGEDAATEIVHPVGSGGPARGLPDQTTMIIRRPASVSTAVTAVSAAEEPDRAEPAPAARQTWREWLGQRWARVAAVSTLGFVLGMLVVTGVEWVRGEPLSGAGQGSTVGTILRGGPSPQMRPEPERDASVPVGDDRPTGDGRGSRTSETQRSEAPVPSGPSRQPDPSASERPPTSSAPKPTTSQQPQPTQQPSKTQQPTGTPAPGPGPGTGTGQGPGTGADAGAGQPKQTPVPGQDRQG
ncbi:hypothetical protein [Streptoalloteichus hindustanus]|uniref:Uncharacterized protein n=1 Tax=Streptoalloteichus hindustanus TaxID=2017 RepID=A0A1M4W7F8_STRHI|nr:hypothetical protein [Streptoalloteichus hindustanus]SHE77198.1 hypothetical protein SAMN05444320_1011035 [Streptoalloteichus hindustanus]